MTGPESPTDERWKPIDWIDARYSISDAGRIRGIFGRVLRPTLMQIGYLSIAISRGRLGVSRHYVHRLVAEAFLGPIPRGMVVNHINHDKLDNRSSNLEIITRSDNGSHWATLGRSPRFKTRRKPENTQDASHTDATTRLPPSDCEWRVSFLEGYLVSDDGRVWSLKTHRLLSPGINTPGYCYINPRIDGRQRPTAIHRLVADAFLHPIPDGMIVDHINGDKRDNRASNLRILTRSENIRQHRQSRRARGLHGLKFNEELIAKVKRDIADGLLSRRQIAERHGLSYSHVQNIASGAQWRHVDPSPRTPPDD